MREVARRILRYRSLLLTLTVRELNARYRGSVLGFLWSLANPLLLFGVYSLVFGLILKQGRIGNVQAYPIFLITSLFPWIWFSSSLLEGASSLLTNAGLLRKAAFPGELLPMVAVLGNLFHFVFALPIVAVALIIGRAMGFPVGGWGLLCLPLVVLLQLPLIAGSVLGLSALTVHFKDMRDLLGNALTLLFFITPIIYPLNAVPAWLGQALVFNPLAQFTLAYQDVVYFGVVPSWSRWAWMIGWSALAWIVGTWIFGRLRGTLVEAV